MKHVQSCFCEIEKKKPLQIDKKEIYNGVTTKQDTEEDKGASQSQHNAFLAADVLSKSNWKLRELEGIAFWFGAKNHS